MKPTWISHVFWITAIILAANFVVILLLVGISIGAGYVPRETWKAAGEVLSGARAAILPKEYEELQSLRKQVAEMEKAVAYEKGQGPVKELALKKAEETAKLREEEARLLLERLQVEQQKLAGIRQEMDASKSGIEAARAALTLEKEKATSVEASDLSKRLKSILAGMDADGLAQDLAVMAAGNDEKLAYAAGYLQLLKPAQVSEVLAAMDPAVRQRIWPLLRNLYADVPPEKVVAEWKDKAVEPLQMKEYLRAMPVEQALGVLRRLERVQRLQVEEILAPLTPATETAMGGPTP
jgi:flagellar motility protein MotE (MotC chaperone)